MANCRQQGNIAARLHVHLWFNWKKPTYTNDQHPATPCYTENRCCMLTGMWQSTI